MKIAQESRLNLYVAGYARHFSRSGANELNEKAWRLGFGKTFRNENGNDESLYLLVTRDFYWIGGYMHQRMAPADNDRPTQAG